MGWILAEPTGIDAALIEAGNVPGMASNAEREASERAQLAMEFGQDVVEHGCEARGVTLAENARPGRPKGAKNRATKELFDALTKMGHKDPLVAASEIVTNGYHALSKALGCSLDDAYDRWVRALEFVAGYKHARPAQAIDLGAGAPAIPIIMGTITPSNENQENSITYDMPVLAVAHSDSRTVTSSD